MKDIKEYLNDLLLIPYFDAFLIALCMGFCMGIGLFIGSGLAEAKYKPIITKYENKLEKANAAYNQVFEDRRRVYEAWRNLIRIQEGQ